MLNGFPQAADPNREEANPTEGSPLEVDRRLKQVLAEAEEDLAQGKTAQALERFQFALSRAKNMLTTREDWTIKAGHSADAEREYVIYRSITGEIERRLAKLPPADLRLYRQTIDADAELILDGHANEAAALEDVVQQYFLSTHGDESAYHLALLWFDQGDYARSARMLQKILADYPDSNISPKQLRLRLALISARMRDTASAQKYWTEYQDLAGDDIPESVRLIYSQELANAEKSPAPNGSSDSRTMQFGSPSRNKDMPILPPGALDEKLSDNWIMPFETQLQQTMPNGNDNTQTLVLAGGQVVQVARSNTGMMNSVQRKPLDQEWRANGWMPARQLYFDQGRMYINGNNRVTCFDSETGRVLWMGRRYDYEPDQSIRYYSAVNMSAPQGTGRTPITMPEVRLFGDRLHPMMTIHDGTAYALEGTLLDWGKAPRDDSMQNVAYAIGTRRSRQNWLTAYDAMTGKLKWHRAVSELPNEQGADQSGFLAAPVPFGDRLLIPVSHKGELWLYSLHQKTGATDWKVFLWDEPLEGVSPWSAVGTAIEGGDIYLATGMGLVFALDAATGKVHWANRYPRNGFRPNANMRAFNPAMLAAAIGVGWMEDVVIPHGNHLVVMPSDYEYIMTLDRSSGNLLWDSHQSLFGGERVNYCLGISGEGLFVAGRDIIRRYDITAGRVVWEQPIVNSLGQAALTADAIYVPTEDAILKLDPATGKTLGMTEVFTPTGEPVGNLFSDGRRLYGVGMQRVYELASLSDRMANLEKSISQGDGQAQLTRMRIHLQKGSLEEAIRDLEQGVLKIRKREGVLHSWVALYGGLEELKLTESQPETALRLLVDAHRPAVVGEERPMEGVSDSITSTLENQRGRLLFSALAAIDAKKQHSALSAVLGATALCTAPHLESQAIRTVTAIARPEDQPLLEAALKDGSIPVRLAAAEALIKCFPDRAQDLAQTLLSDPEDRVELRGVKVLANKGDRSMLKVLAALLDSEDIGVRAQSDSILRALTGQNFRFTAYGTPAARADVVAKWNTWIETEGQSAKLNHPVQFEGQQRGRTLFTNYNSGLLVEIDQTGTEVWRKSGISGPWSCQGLENGNRLVTSYRTRTIHEFDESGKEVWKKDNLPGNPFSVQRLNNGNTLVSCGNNHLYEYTPEGGIAWEIGLNGTPRSAQRLDNGNTLVALYSTQEVIELDPQGKIVWTVPNMNLPITAQRLPNGNTVVGQYNTRQIVELDAAGKVVATRQWDNYLYDVQRLPNGNTLIADNSGLKEIDAEGKIIYQKPDPGVRGISRY